MDIELYDRLVTLESLMNKVLSKLDVIDKKVDDLPYEDTTDDQPVPPNQQRSGQSFDDDFTTEADIRKHGQKIPYNKLEGETQIAAFKEFLSYIRLHEHQFTPKEVEFAGYSYKNFSDIRISDNTRRILAGAWLKLYKKPWTFTFVRGYIIKWNGQIAWEWSDGSE